MEYGKIRRLNAMLLEKYNNNEKELKFYDHYVFHMTSMALSLYRERSLNKEKICMSQILLARSIIEDLAVMRKYDSNELPDGSEYLLSGYQYLCEYKVYKDYKELDGKIFNLNDMEKNYNDAKDEYKKIAADNLKNKEFKSLINSKLPFLESKESFDALIKKYCTKYYQLYKEFSLLIHPSEILTTYTDNNFLNYKDDINNIIFDVENESFKYYGDIEIKKEDTWDFERKTLYGFGNYKSPLVELLEFKCDSLRTASEYIRKDLNISKDKTCVFELFFFIMAQEIESLEYDIIFGFSEVAKSKLKTIIEMCSVFIYVINNNEMTIDYNILLMKEYTILNKKKINNEIDEQDIERVHKIYKKNMDNNISYDKFVDLLLRKSLPEFLGFKNINDFVFKMIDEIIEDNTYKLYAKMMYEESQLLSHGNGYMLTSNYGCFADTSATRMIMNAILSSIIEKYKKSLEYFKDKNNDYLCSNSKLIYDIKKINKIFLKIIKNENYEYQTYIKDHTIQIG